MAESKTARASMRAGMIGEAKKDPFDTPEKKIAELRKQRTDKLFVNRMDFVDALLIEYDKLGQGQIELANQLCESQRQVKELEQKLIAFETPGVSMTSYRALGVEKSE